MKNEKSMMTTKRLPIPEMARVIALLLCIVNCIIVIFMLSKIDPVFNGNVLPLDDIDSYLSLSFVLLAVPVVSSAVAVAAIFVKKPIPQSIPNSIPEIAANPEAEGRAASYYENFLKLEKFEEPDEKLELIPSNKFDFEGLKEDCQRTTSNNKLLVTCPNCRQGLDKPQVRLDFSSGKAVFEDICPHCGFVFEEAEIEDSKSNA